MATPVAHCLAGCSIYYLARVHPSVRLQSSTQTLLIMLLAAASLPDFDFIPGLILGAPERFHREFSHSVAFTSLTTLMVLLYLKASARPAALLVSLSWFCAVLSHLLIDWLSLDTSDPIGIELFWPVSAERFSATNTAFLGVRREDILSEFSIGYNLFAVTWEVILLVPVVAMCRFISDRIIPCRDSLNS